MGKLEAPEHLSERATAIWGLVVPSRARSAGRLVLLGFALEALDRADQCRQVIEAEGLLTKTLTTGTLHRHPLLDMESRSRGEFLKAWRALSLEWSQEDGRSGPFD